MTSHHDTSPLPAAHADGEQQFVVSNGDSVHPNGLSSFDDPLRDRTWTDGH